MYQFVYDYHPDFFSGAITSGSASTLSVLLFLAQTVGRVKIVGNHVQKVNMGDSTQNIT